MVFAASSSTEQFLTASVKIAETLSSAELAAGHDAPGQRFGHFLAIAMVAFLSSQLK
jgi:hypothetical protein